MSVGSGRVDAINRGGTMSAVTFGEAHANAGLPFTVEELDRLPDDGRRYELLDGVLVVSPRPTTIYQFAAFQLGKVLDAACPEGLCVMLEPAVQLTATTIRAIRCPVVLDR
jgi:hypothetical protein